MPLDTHTNQLFLEIYHRQVDSVYRVCYSFMKNPTDAEDITQETFLKLLSKEITFENERHEKAWLIVTASNLCKDALRKWWRHLNFIEKYGAEPPVEEDRTIYEAVFRLKSDYKTVVYLYYYEGYSTAEIAQYLNCPESTVRSRLKRARDQLKVMLGGDM